MGIQDRDWYKELTNERAGYTEKSRFRTGVELWEAMQARKKRRRNIRIFLLLSLCVAVYYVTQHYKFSYLIALAFKSLIALSHVVTTALQHGRII